MAGGGPSPSSRGRLHAGTLLLVANCMPCRCRAPRVTRARLSGPIRWLARSPHLFKLSTTDTPPGCPRMQERARRNRARRPHRAAGDALLLRCGRRGRAVRVRRSRGRRRVARGDGERLASASLMTTVRSPVEYIEARAGSDRLDEAPKLCSCPSRSGDRMGRRGGQRYAGRVDRPRSCQRLRALGSGHRPLVSGRRRADRDPPPCRHRS